MKNQFQRIGLFAKHNNASVKQTFERLIHFLVKRGHTLMVEEKSAGLLSHPFPQIATAEDLGKRCDLVIVIGGDGSLLNAARAVVSHQVPILGINRGTLGFLVDISPNEMEIELNKVLSGHFQREHRFLLQMDLQRNGNSIATSKALNDVVLYNNLNARMIEFEVHINNRFVLRQEADGIITATPTGSTAYALSAGGPILYPTLNALSLTPLSPHTLSSRPIVVDSASLIKLIVTSYNINGAQLSCDGQVHFELQAGDEIRLEKYPNELILIHPEHHEYFSVLRKKLGWNILPSKD